jgi:glycosyltransferase involved in cell wall biosynthesis
MNDNPIVSVCMITYGHEKFIEHAINGVLMQECDFEIELIIANDCSPDATDEIINRIIKSHPKGNVIKYIRHNKNKGIHSNFIWTINEAKGKYIALCEGDDYWIDPNKLQKQVDFLEENIGFVGSYHNTLVVYENEDKQHIYRENMKQQYEAEDTLSTWSLFHTSSFIFKKECFVYKNFFEKCFSADMALFSIISLSGLLGKVDGTMSVYRKNDFGITSNDVVFYESFYVNRIALLGYLNQMHNYKYDYKYKKSIEELLQSMRFSIEKKINLSINFSYFGIIRILNQKLGNNLKQLFYGK